MVAGKTGMGFHLEMGVCPEKSCSLWLPEKPFPSPNLSSFLGEKGSLIITYQVTVRIVQHMAILSKGLEWSIAWSCGLLSNTLS